ncbi:MAG: hypothetical protein O3A14_18700 [Cyanobacteria bacterium]|nr:hypothetical protein [Cyanobacteriota bacterium]
MPAYQVIAWFFLGALTFTASEDLSTKLLGVVITFAGIAFYIESRKKTERNYLLELELNSGSSTYFKSASGDFLGKFIEGLDYVMKNPHAERFIEADFTTQQIQEVNYLNNLIDISDDIVQEFIRASTTQSLSASRQR